MNTKLFNLKETIGLPFLPPIDIEGYADKCDEVPDLDPNYVWDKQVLRTMVAWWLNGDDEGIYLFGPTGAGKSSAIYQFCAYFNIPVYEKSCYEMMEYSEIIGHYTLMGGNTIYSYGILPRAMGVEGQPGVLLLNEVDRANEGLLTSMNEVLCGRPLTLDGNGGEIIKPEKGFRFCATGNTNLLGGDQHIYTSAKRHDLSFSDRLWKAKVMYPDAETEKGILQNILPGLPETNIDLMIRIANNIRDLFMGTKDEGPELEITMSTRTLIRWAKLSYAFRNASSEGINPMEMALETSLTAIAPEEQKIAIHEILNAEIGD
jgi:cobaltochelatase CobS